MRNAIVALLYLLNWGGNVVGWVVLGDNANERYPIGVFATCIVAGALAGFLAVKVKEGDWKQWVLWSTVLGVVLAVMLTAMV